MPIKVMRTMVAGTKITNEWTLGVMNLPPFEGVFEIAIMDIAVEDMAFPKKVYTLSISDNVECVRYAERTVALHLLQVRLA